MIAFTFFLFAIVNRYYIQQSGDELSPQHETLILSGTTLARFRHSLF
jgi:hypothetical protein